MEEGVVGRMGFYLRPWNGGGPAFRHDPQVLEVVPGCGQHPCVVVVRGGSFLLILVICILRQREVAVRTARSISGSVYSFLLLFSKVWAIHECTHASSQNSAANIQPCCLGLLSAY